MFFPPAHLVSLPSDWVLQLGGGEEHSQVVVQNGLLADAAQSKVLKEPDEGQKAAISENRFKTSSVSGTTDMKKYQSEYLNVFKAFQGLTQGILKPCVSDFAAI